MKRIGSVSIVSCLLFFFASFSLSSSFAQEQAAQVKTYKIGLI